MTTYSPSTDILANGEWVRRGLVWHWRANPAATNEPSVELKEVPDYLPRDLIACPKCFARMDESCKTDGGWSHTTRLVKRVCSCGGTVRPREPMCGWCRAEMTRSAA